MKYVLLFVIIVIVLILIFRKPPIPKIIWSFWDGEQPPIVKACIDSWRRMAPDYEIRILDKESTKDIQKYKRSSDFVQRYSDFVRLDRLSNNGGIWLDASVYLTKPLDWIQDGSDFVGFKYTKPEQSNPELPLVVNWFFACKKDSIHVKDWYDEMKKMDSFETVQDYLNSLSIDISKVDGPDYIIPYVCSMVIRSEKKYSNLKLMDIEKYSAITDYQISLDEFCDNNIDPNFKLIKFDRGHRKTLDKMYCKIIK
jgi:hypothetical protein